MKGKYYFKTFFFSIRSAVGTEGKHFDESLIREKEIKQFHYQG